MCHIRMEVYMFIHKILYNMTQHGGFLEGEYPKMVGVNHEKHHYKMDDLGLPLF